MDGVANKQDRPPIMGFGAVDDGLECMSYSVREELVLWQACGVEHTELGVLAYRAMGVAITMNSQLSVPQSPKLQSPLSQIQQNRTKIYCPRSITTKSVSKDSVSRLNQYSLKQRLN